MGATMVAVTVVRSKIAITVKVSRAEQLETERKYQECCNSEYEASICRVVGIFFAIYSVEDKNYSQKSTRFLHYSVIVLQTMLHCLNASSLTREKSGA